MPNLHQTLVDFPKSEIWRLQTDGWQARRGRGNFRPQFYRGMDAGFKFINDHGNEELTPALIEGIYQSAFQFEENYAKEETLRKGYSEEYGGFEIFFPLQGVEHEAGVSEAGLRELIAATKKTFANKGTRRFPQYAISYEINSLPGTPKTGTVEFDPNEHKDEESQALLTEHLLNATRSKEGCTDPIKIPVEKLTKVEIASFRATREEVLQWVQADINAYKAELAAAKAIADPDQRKKAEIKAINHFIRKLHQSHYFPDGNGRTFVFLLANMLLIQNGHGMKITENPAHYAGFSSEELLQETMHDLKHFQEYTITRAKGMLMNLDAKAVLDDREQFKSVLVGQFSQDPLIAMAQINELFLQIQSNQIIFPRGYAPPPTGFLSGISKSILGKPNADIKTAHFQILNILKEMYTLKLEAVVANSKELNEEERLGFQSKESPDKILEGIVKSHQISNNLNQQIIKDVIADYGKEQVVEFKLHSSS